MIIGVYFNLPLPGCLSFATVGFFVVLLATTALDSNGPHWNTVRIQDTEMGEPITSEKVPFSNQATARSDDLVSDLRVSTTKGCLNRSHNEPSGGKPCDAPSLSSRSSAADQVEESRRSAGTRHNIATAYAADTIEDDFGYGPFLRILKLPLDAPADTLLSDSSSIHLSEYIGPLPKHIPYTLDDFERDFNGS